MEIIVARHAGVCYGVRRALTLATETSDSSGPVKTLGPLIHNPLVVEQLRGQGIDVADTLEDATEGTLVVRSHGVAPDVIDAAKGKGLAVVDATCPHVTAVQEAAGLLAREGYFVIIVGEDDHPEVEGIRGWAGDGSIVVETVDELPERLGTRKVGVVVQTTQSIDRLRDIVSALLVRAGEVRIFNTICAATTLRQESAAELARDVDVVIVVGGHNSGNTTRLAEISREYNDHVHHIESVDELDERWVSEAARVGVTAGASTPEEQIEAVVGAIRSFGA